MRSSKVRYKNKQFELFQFTPISKQILELVGNGKTQTEVGELIGCSKSTVSYHVKRFKEQNLEWSPGIVRHRNGKQLLEEVRGNTIFIFVEDFDQAKQLLSHGFLEWLLNQNTKGYRLLINELIETIEELQYNHKERIIEAISRLI